MGMARGYIAYDLAVLGSAIGYIDLLLLHTPCNVGSQAGHNYSECAAIYAVMEEAVRNGTVRSIGVSNFEDSDLEALKSTWTIKPAVNQMRTSLGGVDQKTWDYCKREGISYMAYSPLHSPCLHDPTVQSVASAHNVSTVTATNKSSHMISDLSVFDFSLTDGEMHS